MKTPPIPTSAERRQRMRLRAGLPSKPIHFQTRLRPGGILRFPLPIAAKFGFTAGAVFDIRVGAEAGTLILTLRKAPRFGPNPSAVAREVTIRIAGNPRDAEVAAVLPMPRVLDVHARPDFSLLLWFATGELRRFDFLPWLDKLPYRPLRNPELFAQAYLEHGTVAWSRYIDMAPEILYDRSVPSAHPLDDLRVEFPLILRPDHIEESSPFGTYGFELFSDGWRPQIRRILALLEVVAESRRKAGHPLPCITCIDERHGELRIRVGPDLPLDVWRQIKEIVAETRTVCSVCGHPGRATAPAFGQTRCPIHWPAGLTPPYSEGAPMATDDGSVSR